MNTIFTANNHTKYADFWMSYGVLLPHLTYMTDWVQC